MSSYIGREYQEYEVQEELNRVKRLHVEVLEGVGMEWSVIWFEGRLVEVLLKELVE